MNQSAAAARVNGCAMCPVYKEETADLKKEIEEKEREIAALQLEKKLSAEDRKAQKFYMGDDANSVPKEQYERMRDAATLFQKDVVRIQKEEEAKYKELEEYAQQMVKKVGDKAAEWKSRYARDPELWESHAELFLHWAA